MTTDKDTPADGSTDASQQDFERAEELADGSGTGNTDGANSPDTNSGGRPEKADD